MKYWASTIISTRWTLQEEGKGSSVLERFFFFFFRKILNEVTEVWVFGRESNRPNTHVGSQAQVLKKKYTGSLRKPLEQDRFRGAICSFGCSCEELFLSCILYLHLLTWIILSSFVFWAGMLNILFLPAESSLPSFPSLFHEMFVLLLLLIFWIYREDIC